MLFQYLLVFYKSSIYNVCTKSSNFSVFSKFYQYLFSEFSINTGKSVYLAAMHLDLAASQLAILVSFLCGHANNYTIEVHAQVTYYWNVGTWIGRWVKSISGHANLE